MILDCSSVVVITNNRKAIVLKREKRREKEKNKASEQQIYLPTQSASADSGTVSVIELKALVVSESQKGA